MILNDQLYVESKHFQKIVCFDSTHKVEIPQLFPTHKNGKQKSAKRSGFSSFILVHWLLRNFTLQETYSWVKKTEYNFYRQKKIPSWPKKPLWLLEQWVTESWFLVAFAIVQIFSSFFWKACCSPFPYYSFSMSSSLNCTGSQQDQAEAAMGPCAIMLVQALITPAKQPFSPTPSLSFSPLSSYPSVSMPVS